MLAKVDPEKRAKRQQMQNPLFPKSQPECSSRLTSDNLRNSALDQHPHGPGIHFLAPALFHTALSLPRVSPPSLRVFLLELHQLPRSLSLPSVPRHERVPFSPLLDENDYTVSCIDWLATPR